MAERRDRREALWRLALVTSAVPLLYELYKSLLSLFSEPRGGVGYGIPFSAACEGRWLWMDLEPLHWLSRQPILIVAVTFVLWTTTRSRVPGWVAVTALLVTGLTGPLLMAYDLARSGGACAQLWRSFTHGTFSWATVFTIVPAALIYATLHRRRGLGRPATALTIAAVMLFMIGGDQARDRVVVIVGVACPNVHQPGPGAGDDVAKAEAIGRMPVAERERTYLCVMRVLNNSPYDTQRPRFEDVADRELLWRGRRACADMRRADGSSDGRPIGPGINDWIRLRAPSEALGYLCPDVMLRRARAAAERHSALRLEYQRKRSRDAASCDRSARRDPEAARQETELVMTSEGGGYYITEGQATMDVFSAAIADRLIASRGASAAVMTGVENTYFCLTVRAYRQVPPLDLQGWDRVAEVGIDSWRGALRIFIPTDRPPVLPTLTASGPGPYRIRVHVRDRDEAKLPDGPLERHLVQVFPGQSKTPVLHKNIERR